MTEQEIVEIVKNVAPESMEEAIALLSVLPGQREKTDPVSDIIVRFEIEGGHVVVATRVYRYHKLRIYVTPHDSAVQTLHWEIK
jgi:hypothetical protein